jgi:4-hydroxy-3-methylbut-2-en-1-yl diphosphate reductase
LAKEVKKELKITVGRYSGFCFGVKRAYELACVNSRNCEKLYILGKLVHNNDACSDLEKKGIKEIKSLYEIKEGTVIFAAHGVGPESYQRASNLGIKIIDSTCPKVIKSQRLAKNYAEKGWQVLIFGNKKHREMKGIKEWSKNKSKIVASLEEIKKLKLDKKGRYCLLSQTTQNVAEFKEIKSYFAKNFPNFAYFNTICDATNDRQKEVRKLATNSDAVVVVGGHDSANSERLWEIAKAINPKSYFIENEKGLKKEWLKSVKNIAISAGASTPEWVIKKVVDKIKKIA